MEIQGLLPAAYLLPSDKAKSSTEGNFLSNFADVVLGKQSAANAPAIYSGLGAEFNFSPRKEDKVSSQSKVTRTLDDAWSDLEKMIAKLSEESDQNEG